MSHARPKAERLAQIAKIKEVLKKEPNLSVSQLRERFRNATEDITEARRQLLAEGVDLPNARRYSLA